MHPTSLLAVFGTAVLLGGLWAVRRVRLNTMVGCSLGVAAAAVGVAVLTLAAGLRVYDVFTRETLIARVHCTTLAPQQFLLRYQSVDGARREYALRGDEWMMDGLILKWHPCLILLGLQTVQKPVRIGGRYTDVHDQTANYPIAYDLNGGVDWTWRLLQAVGRYWPGVEAVYGSSAYVPADPGVAYGVYAAASGYMIKPLPQH